MEAKLRARKLAGHIHRKGERGRPLTEQATGSNRIKLTVRVRVEHIFGAHANNMGGTPVRTTGQGQNEDEELCLRQASPCLAASSEPLPGLTPGRGNRAKRP
jgi:hypothetical protein